MPDVVKHSYLGKAEGRILAGISSDIIRGYNDTMILYLLLDRPSYGYEISRTIRMMTDGKYAMKETTLYSAFAGQPLFIGQL